MALLNVGVPPQLPPDHTRERSRSPTRNLGGKLTGIAKRWNDTQGFGFIKPDDGSEDIFCHRTSIEDGDCFIEGAPLAYIKGWDERKNKERAEQVTGGSHRGTAGAPQPYGGGAVAYGAAAGAYGASAGYPPASYAGAPPSYAAPPGYAAAAAVAAGMMTGMVKRWNEAQGFGFIKPDDGTEDLFVHRTSIEGAEALPDGARVSFLKGYDQAKGKIKADKVVIVGGAPSGMPSYGYGAPAMFAGAAGPYGALPPPNYAYSPYGAPPAPQYAPPPAVSVSYGGPGGGASAYGGPGAGALAASYGGAPPGGYAYTSAPTYAPPPASWSHGGPGGYAAPPPRPA